MACWGLWLKGCFRPGTPARPAMTGATGMLFCAEAVGLAVGAEPANVLPDARQPTIASAEATTTPTRRQDSRPPIDPTLTHKRCGRRRRARGHRGVVLRWE
jgi:hypothetical protein